MVSVTLSSQIHLCCYRGNSFPFSFRSEKLATQHFSEFKLYGSISTSTLADYRLATNTCRRENKKVYELTQTLKYRMCIRDMLSINVAIYIYITYHMSRLLE